MLKKKSSPLSSDDGCNVALYNDYRSFILKFVSLMLKPLHFCINPLKLKTATGAFPDMLWH